MSIPTWRLCLVSCALVWLMPGLLAASAPAATTSAVSQPAPAVPTPAQLKEIKAATQPQALVDLARRFFILRQEPASRLCIEKACLADPSLLADSKLVSPRSWRKFWFRYRAYLRVRKLAPSDAAGRVAIAVWLHEGEERGEARRMLRAALEIDPNLEAAKALAKTWRLDSGGPFQFDLLFGLTHPLLLDSFTDEGERLEPRRGRRYMLLPFAYDPAEGPLRITKSSVQVMADGNQRCSVQGIVLLSSDSSARVEGSAPTMADPSLLRIEDQPLWERIQVERKEDGSLDLVASNLTRPPGKRPAGKSKTSSGYKSSTPPPPPEAPLRPVPSGYGAFLVEVPELVKSVEAVFEDDVRMSVETRFLDVLGQPVEQVSPQEQGRLVDLLAETVLSPNALLASAAVGKLDLIRRSVGLGEAAVPSAQPGTGQPASVAERIDQTLWSSLANKNAVVRRRAFISIVHSEQPLSPALLTVLRDPAQASLTLTILDQVEQLLVSAATAGDASTGSPQTTVDPRLAEQAFLVGLEMSSAPPNVFRVLEACVGSAQAEVAQRTLEIVLADGSTQSVSTLAGLSPQGRLLLADRLKGVKDPALKAALVRLLLSRPDPEMVGKAIEACRDLKLVVNGPGDPILNVFRGRPAIEVEVELVQLLAKADLSAVADSEELSAVLASLAMDAQRSPALQSALLGLAKSVFQASYEAPIAAVRRSGSVAAKSSPFGLLLGRIATIPNVDSSTLREAAVTLLSAGRVQELKERLAQMPSPADRVRLINAIGPCKELWDREALPLLLANCLSDNDPKPVLAALSNLADIYKAADSKTRWRLNLAVKIGLDAPALMRWTQAPDEKLSRLAVSLLRQLARMNRQESEQLEALTDPAARQQFLLDIDKQRIEKPVGKYGCMVYVDLTSLEAAGSASGLSAIPGAESTEQRKPICGIPLIASTVTIQKEGAASPQVMADGRYIGMPDEHGTVASSPGQMRVDGSQLLLDGLKWAYDQKLPFAAKVDRLALGNRLECNLRHERLGTWVGEFTIAPSATPDRLAPLQVVYALVVIEPLEESPAPAKPTPVEQK